uniref:KxYKxGKxW signal peptide domain-containing protein n=1 Tax=Streptococcus halichoeri TaxID=254785 RepID=UPI001916E9E3
MEKKDSTKVGFRMWKSGKRWLFSGIALAATLMIGTSAISADVNVDGAATDHKDICLTVHDLHDENEDENQCAFWYKEEPTDKGPHRDEEIIPPFGGGPGGSTWHGGVHVETGGRATPTDKGPHKDEEIIPPFGGGPGGSTWHGGVHVETGGRATPT